MGFSGDLADIGLSDIFANVASNRLSGTLHIFNEQRSFFVYFARGKLRMAASPENTTVVSTMPRRATRRGLVSLIEGDDEESEHFRNRLRIRIREDVYEAFAWRGCQFEFIDGDPRDSAFPEEQLLAEIDLDVEPILMEAAHRTDEWSRIHELIRSFDEVFTPVGTTSAEALAEDPVLADVYAMFDGQTDLQSIIDRSEHGRFEVCKATADLMRRDSIRPLTVEERIQLVDRIAGDDVAQAIRMLCGALESTPDDPALRYQLGDLYAAAGRREEAAQSLCHAGDAYHALDQVEDAITAYRRAIELCPADAAVRERMFRSLVEQTMTEEAVEHGLELAEIYINLGLADRARSLYVELSTLASGDSVILERRADCENNVGNRREAVRIYRSLASGALKRNDVEYAASMIDEMLKIDARDVEARRMLRQIEESKKQTRASNRRRMRKAAMWSLGVGILVYAVVYELMARTALHDIQSRNTRLILNGDFLEAIRNLDGLRTSYPLSLARVESGILIEELARGQIDRIESQPALPDVHDTMSDLQRIMSLAIAPDIYERARTQITRVRIQEKVQERFAHLKKDRKREEAIEWIKRFDDRFAEGFLQELLQHEDPETRMFAIYPLVNMKSFRSIPKIIKLLEDESPIVRSRAQKALLPLTGHATTELDFDYWNKWWKETGARRFQALTAGS